MEKSGRIQTIDVARSIGLCLIFLAHVLGPGSLLFQIRSFDVPLMVFVSGLVSSRKKVNDYWAFVKKRVLRLIVPVWIFYVFYFFLLYITDGFGGNMELPYWGYIVKTFLCIEGYGWIIRVFILIALVSPFLVIIEEKVPNKWLYLLVVIGSIAIAVLFDSLLLGKELAAGTKLIFVDCFLYLLGYVPAFLVGLRMRNAEKDERLIYFVPGIVIICYVLFRVISGLDLEQYKWPPQLPFVCYGIAVSVLVWSFQRILELLAHVRLFVFMGQNTIWLYLWHIMALSFVFRITGLWYIQYLIVFAFALTVFFIQFCCVDKKLKRWPLSKYLVG